MKNEGPAEVLLVGVFHFAGSAGDAIELIVPDILKEHRQREVEQLVDVLAEFRPTRVALEIEPQHDQSINSRYRDYLTGKQELGPTEQQQLGFRLAARMNLDRVDLIDHMFETPFGPLFEVMERDEPEASRQFWDDLRRLEAESHETLKQDGIQAAIAALNEPEALSRNHDMYLSFARFGAAGSYEGATLLGAWYVRNARMFANICQLLKPGQRIAVLIGAGHVPILKQLMTAHEGIRLRMFHDHNPTVT